MGVISIFKDYNTEKLLKKKKKKNKFEIGLESVLKTFRKVKKIFLVPVHIIPDEISQVGPILVYFTNIF